MPYAVAHPAVVPPLVFRCLAGKNARKRHECGRHLAQLAQKRRMGNAVVCTTPVQRNDNGSSIVFQGCAESGRQRIHACSGAKCELARQGQSAPPLLPIRAPHEISAPRTEQLIGGGTTLLVKSLECEPFSTAQPLISNPSSLTEPQPYTHPQPETLNPKAKPASAPTAGPNHPSMAA